MHKCPNCSFKSTHVSLIHEHLLNFHKTLKNVLLKCRICEWQCSSFVKFKSHLLVCSKNSKDNFSCTVCNQDLAFQSVRKHLLDHLNHGQTVKCPLCELHCSTVSGFKSHIHRLHNNLSEFLPKSQKNLNCIRVANLK